MNALLLDAENLNGPSFVAEAYRTIERNHGPIHVAMAFGSQVHLECIGAICGQLGISRRETPFAVKNAADREIVKAAEYLASHRSGPLTIAIGSGDADFLPLSYRLRKSDVETACIARSNITSAGAIGAFDFLYALDSKHMHLASEEQLEYAILDCLPELRQGDKARVTDAVRRLRLWRIAPRHSTGIKAFARLPERFEVTEEMGVAYVRHVR